MDYDVIADLTEGAVYEALRQAMAENDDGHAAGKEVVATTNGNVVEQVLHTITHG